MDILIKRLKALPCFLVTLLFFVHVINGADPVYSPAGLTDSSGNSIDSAAAVTWADLPSGQPYQSDVPSRVSAGLEPYYGLVHSFINSVFSQGIPTGIIDKAVAGDLGSIASNYSDYVSYFIGYAICVVVGVLFMLIFPLVACCFCCCRCCGNCGGKMKQSEEDADSMCKKYVFAAILLVAVMFLTVGMACIYVNNDNTSTTLNSISSTTSKNLGDIKLFVNNTATQASHIARTNFNFLKLAVGRDLDNIEYLVGLPLRTEIETQTNIRATLTTAYSLSDDLNTADTKLADVETKLNDLQTALDSLTTALSDWQIRMAAIFTTCGASCSGSQPDYASANTGVDSSNFPNLAGPRTSMDQAKGTNLTAQIQDAENELDSIPERVGNDSLTNRNDLKITLDDLADDIDPLVNQIDDLNGQISGKNATIDLDSFSDQIDSFEKTIKQYDQYRWYGGIGLASIVLLVIVMAVFGMIFGVIGSSISTAPSQRGCVSNCGGVFLMWSAAFVFLFSALLMLLTLVTFLIGAPLHRFACVPITDLDELEKLVTIYNDQEVGKGKYFLGNMLLGNDTIALTVTGLLRDCKNGKSALNAFKLDNKFDIDDILNYSKTLDVQKEIDKITVDFSGVTIFPAALNTQLTDLKAAVNIDFTEFYVELGKTPTTTDLSTLADSIDTYAATVANANAKTSLQDEAILLRAIETNEYAAVVAKIAALNSSVAAMDAAVSNIPTSVDTLTTGLTVADTYIQTNASTVTKSLLNTYVTRIIGIVDSYVAYTRDSVYNKMGTCEPVWNTYNSMMVYTLCYNIMDTFNGFWFSLGWCIFFFMFSLIFSVKLAKYFRRMEPDDVDTYGDSYSDKDRFTDAQVVTAMPSKPQLWMRNNKVHHSDNDW